MPRRATRQPKRQQPSRRRPSALLRPPHAHGPTLAKEAGWALFQEGGDAFGVVGALHQLADQGLAVFDGGGGGGVKEVGPQLAFGGGHGGGGGGGQQGRGVGEPPV